MKRKTAAAVLAAGIVAGGGAALVAPGVALAANPTPSASSSATDRAASRLTAIKDALKGLVGKGTISQSQADEVASTLATAGVPFGGHGRGPGGPGVLTPEATAAVIGVTPQQLRDAQVGGKTLAQIAATKGISKADLISRLAAAANKQLDADLAAGRLTQAQHDSIASDLTARVTERVDQVGRPHRGPGDGDDDGDGDGPGAPVPSTTAAPKA